MSQSPFKTGAPSGPARDFQPPTGSQLLRQLGVIALVLVVWSGLLAGFATLTGKPAQEPVGQTPPTEAPGPTAAPTLAPAAETPTQTPEVETDEEATPIAKAPTEALPTNTPLPPPTDTPPPAPTDTPPPAEPGVSFAADVLPIFESRCLQCHGENRIEGDLVLNSYQAVMTDSESGPSVLPGDAAHSRLVELIVSGDMPRRGPRLTPAQIQTITDWIDAGALDN